MTRWRLLLLVVAVGGYDSLSAAHFWNSSVVDASRVSPPQSGIAGILHLHVPKTGGSSLIKTLWVPMAENSEDRCLLRAFESYENVVSWANGEACNFTAPVVIVGHVSFDIVRASAIMKTPRVFSVTFLRDPLARVLSFANFKNVALEEFLGGAWTRIATNVATLMLNGVNDAAPQTQYSLLQSPVEGMCQNDPVEAIASARHQLVDVITVFGITEHFVEAMWLLMKTFGWDIETVKGPLLHPKKAFCAGSVDPEDCGKNYFTVEDIDPDTQAAIRKAEVCDYAVYETALDVFHARIAAGDQEDLADFKSAIRAAELEVSR